MYVHGEPRRRTSWGSGFRVLGLRVLGIKVWKENGSSNQKNAAAREPRVTPRRAMPRRHRCKTAASPRTYTLHSPPYLSTMHSLLPPLVLALPSRQQPSAPHLPRQRSPECYSDFSTSGQWNREARQGEGVRCFADCMRRDAAASTSLLGQRRTSLPPPCQGTGVKKRCRWRWSSYQKKVFKKFIFAGRAQRHTNLGISKKGKAPRHAPASPFLPLYLGRVPS